jgi:uncharacterized membrane protein YGL010W
MKPRTLPSLLVHIRACYEDELTFYRKYHTHSINNAIHMVCVPLEWTAFLILANVVQLHYVVSVIIAAYYLLLHSKAKYIAAIGHMVLAFVSTVIYSGARSLGWWYVMVVAVGMQLGAWTLQVGVGHHMFEKKSPAMTDKLTLNSIILSVILAWDT